MNHVNQPHTIAAGHIHFSDGTKADLASLIRHHYRPGLPATCCVVRVARVRDPSARVMRTVAVAVLSWPVPMLKARNRHFDIIGYGACLRFANRNVRTISRVIVHPQYRAAGLAQELVRQLVDRCPTRYVESSSSMGAYAGFLARCGFVSIATPPGEPAYFLLDRKRIVSPKSRTRS